METSELVETNYNVTGMSCTGCADTVQKTLSKQSSVLSAEVDLESEVANIKSEEPLNLDRINKELREVGNYSLSKDKPSTHSNNSHDHQKEHFWTDKKKWKRSGLNTFSCLVGCSIGDFGMVFFLQAYYPSTPLMWQMALAIVAGLCTSILLETILMKVREGFDWVNALKTAFGMSFISMVAMEIAMTSTDFIITGGKAAFSDPMYWLALIPALIVGFITPLPYNYYKLKKHDKACH